MHDHRKEHACPPVLEDTMLVDYLRSKGLLMSNKAKLVPLAGGVSSDILLVESETERFVVKRSLPQLKVEDDWHCDTKRNVTEFEAIHYAAQLFPESVPQLLLTDSDNRLFVMEYFGTEFTPWKTQLLRGEVDLEVAGKTANLLAILHKTSWGAPAVAATFDTGADFYALRIEPYLLTTGQRHPDLKRAFDAEADRLQRTSLSLVHGDWSAKNILVSKDRVIILDWEAAWFGDPAFDAAFFLALVHLKAIHNRKQAAGYFDLIHTFRTTYAKHLPQFDQELRRRIGRLTLMLMLARIDGKSPAEYITSEETKNRVRTFAQRLLIEGIDEPDELSHRWEEVIESA